MSSAKVSICRSIACFVLLVYHSKWFGFLNTKHQAEMFRLTEAPEHQWVVNGPLMVDIFFGISGFLMSYRFLENERQMEQIRAASFGKNVRLFGKMVLQRYLRYEKVEKAKNNCVRPSFSG
jgi:peptidoglycan/LPS O-acetylase OafA/YrhL